VLLREMPMPPTYVAALPARLRRLRQQRAGDCGRRRCRDQHRG